MRNTLLALSMVSMLAGVAPAFAADSAVDVSAGTAKVGETVLDMPAIPSRRKMLFSFGVFGTGIHIGWKKPLPKDQAAGHFRGVGAPILYTSVGTKGFGINTPKREKIMMNDKQS
jgi:hypothetical protein